MNTINIVLNILTIITMGIYAVVVGFAVLYGVWCITSL